VPSPLPVPRSAGRADWVWLPDPALRRAAVALIEQQGGRVDDPERPFRMPPLRADRSGPDAGTLACADRGVTDVTGLDTLVPLLRRVDLAGNPLGDQALPVLRRLRGVESLVLSGTAITDLSGLVGLEPAPSGFELAVERTAVSDLASLGPDLLRTLTVLQISGSRVSDLTPLEVAVHLRALLAACTRVHDLTPLAAATGMYWLDITGADVADLAPVAGWPELTALLADENRITDLSPLGSRSSLMLLSAARQRVRLAGTAAATGYVGGSGRPGPAAATTTAAGGSRR
jgi:hypothetical protein